LKLRPNCREVTELVLLAQEKPLSLGERVAVRMHLLICKACPRFLKQVQLMRQASERWRHYSEE